MKKINECNITFLIHHMLTTNICYMADLALMKFLFTKYKNFYKAHYGQDMECIVKENNHLKVVIKDFQGKEEEKEKQISNLKATIANLDKWILEKSNEVIKKENELS